MRLPSISRILVVCCLVPGLSPAQPGSQPKGEPTNAAEAAAKKAQAQAKTNAKYQAWVATLPPEQQAWEQVLQAQLGSFYLPLHQADKLAGRSNAWDFVADDPKLPRVLLIGDSVSRGYTQAVRKALAGKVNVHRAPANCGPTASGIKNLEVWLGDGKWDLIHFNFGIHDRNTPLADYTQRLEELILRMQKTGAKLVWTSTTPIPDTPDGKQTAASIVARNAAAAELMQKHGIPTDDLFAAITPHLGTMQNPNDVHFTTEGYNFLGKQVAECIQKMLKPGSALNALELFCGIGGFAAVAGERGIAVTSAVDQDADARSTYELNFSRHPDGRTLDALDLDTLPGADIWWMSPPCTPFSRRGAQRDAHDPRAVGFLRLIEAAARRQGSARPRFIVVENVAGFLGSEVHRRLWQRWTASGYSLSEAVFCPTQFGVPMKRPRVFLAASAVCPAPALELPAPRPIRQPLAGYLDPGAQHDPALRLPRESIDRYGPSLNVVNPADPNACAICFTSGYGKSWKAAGSFLPCPDGGLRRFSPVEILRLLGFPPEFRFPESLSLARRWHLAGNSLALPCVRHILGQIGS